jgi:putative addiction module component (TIGR02574 family)
MHVVDIPELSNLSTAEKILLVEDLWDSIASDEDSIPIPESHKAELDRRLDTLKATPGSLLTLEELKSRVDRRK